MTDVGVAFDYSDRKSSMRFRRSNEQIVLFILKICALQDWTQHQKSFNMAYKVIFYIVMISAMLSMILKVMQIQSNLIAVLNYLMIAAISLISQLRLRGQLSKVRTLLNAVRYFNRDFLLHQQALKGISDRDSHPSTRLEAHIQRHFRRTTLHFNNLLTVLVSCGAAAMLLNICMPILYKCFDGRSDDFSHIYPNLIPYITEYQRHSCVYFLLFAFESVVTLFVTSLYINSLILFIYFTVMLILQYQILMMRMRALLDGKSSPQRLHRVFTQHVQKHQSLLSYFTTLNAVYKWFMLDVIVFCAGFFSLVLAHMTEMVEMEHGLMVMPKVLSIVLCYMLVLYCYSYYGTRVMNLNRELSNSLYETDWYNYTSDPSYRVFFKSMQFFSLRCLKPLTLRAADTFVFSLAIVSEVFRFSFSLFNCILIKGQKHKSAME